MDDQQVNETSLHVPVASPPSGFYIDMWSANSTWSGSMEVGEDATLDILWIEMLFNTTQGVQTSGQKRVCAVQGGIVMQTQQSGSAVTYSNPLMLLVTAILLALALM